MMSKTPSAIASAAPRWMTVDEFKRRYAVSHTKAYSLFKSGALPKVKVGRSTRVSVAAADAWAHGLEEKGRGPRSGELVA